MSGFTENEKARIFHHLGYPNWRKLAQSIQLGYPMASQPFFLVQDSLNRIDEASVPSIRRDLCECDAIESQISDSRSRMKASRLGDLETNPREVEMLWRELDRWQTRLADDLGVQKNPYSQQEWRGTPGGMFARVEG